MAQVTLSGKMRFAYEATDTTTSGTAVKANGLRVTDGNFTLSSTEDLGAGLKVVASMDVQSRGRDTTVAGRDASITVMGGFGSVTIGSVEAGNGIIGLGGAGAPVYGMDGTVISGASNVDLLKYTSPELMAGLKVSFTTLDNTAAGTSTLGMGSTSDAQDATVVGVTYAAGPLAVAADITNYGRNGIAAATTVADDRTRVSASYDLGVAKIGYGYQVAATTATTNNKTKQQIIGVSVPMGALTLGLNYATSQADGATKAKGTDLGAKYDLSKRTYIAVHMQNLTDTSGSAVAAGNDLSKYRVQLSHAF
jgi:predicted porin